MFTSYHFIWLFICFAIIGISLYCIFKNKIDFTKILNISCVVCVLSEITKTFSAIKILPMSDGSGFVPYLEMNHLPLHLCSIEIIFIFYLKFSKKDNNFYHKLLAFMYPACILGATGALFIPTIFSTTISVKQAFTHPMAYQFFLYHTMLVVLGFSIYHFYKNELGIKNYFQTLLMAAIMFFISIYFNSIFSIPHYENGQLISIDKSVNFFFSAKPPINIPLTNVWSWIAYLIIFMLIGAVLVLILYIPLIIKKK